MNHFIGLAVLGFIAFILWRERSRGAAQGAVFVLSLLLVILLLVLRGAVVDYVANNAAIVVTGLATGVLFGRLVDRLGHPGSRQQGFAAHDYWLAALLGVLVVVGLIGPSLDPIVRKMTGLSGFGIELEFDTLKNRQAELYEMERRHKTEEMVLYIKGLPGAIDRDIRYLTYTSDPMTPAVERRIATLRTAKAIIGTSFVGLVDCIERLEAGGHSLKAAMGPLRPVAARFDALVRIGPAAPPRRKEAAKRAAYEALAEAQRTISETLGGGQPCGGDALRTVGRSGRAPPAENADAEAASDYWPYGIPDMWAAKDDGYVFVLVAYLHGYIGNLERGAHLLLEDANTHRSHVNYMFTLAQMMYLSQYDYRKFSDYYASALQEQSEWCRRVRCQDDLPPDEVGAYYPGAPSAKDLRALQINVRRGVASIRNNIAFSMAQALAAGEDGAEDLAYEAREHAAFVRDYAEHAVGLSKLVRAGLYDTYAFVTATFEMAERRPDRDVLEDARDASEKALSLVNGLSERDRRSSWVRTRVRFVRTTHRLIEGQLARL